ncbi:unnamed protein product, partial [Rotaria sordida]
TELADVKDNDHLIENTSTKTPLYQTPGLAALVENNPLEQSHTSTHDLRRKYQLHRTSNTQSYGFSLDKNEKCVIKIGTVTLSSPAAEQGLRVGDRIISVNNENVVHMNPSAFTQYLSDILKQQDCNGGSILLEIKREYTYEPSSRDDSNIVEESYPKLRLCTIRSWPHYTQLGFNIVSSTSRDDGNDEFRIEQVQKDSPAAYTNIHDGDYLIEINERKVENIHKTPDSPHVPTPTPPLTTTSNLAGIFSSHYEYITIPPLVIKPINDEKDIENIINFRPSAPYFNSYHPPVLSRAAINVIHGQSVYRFCRLEPQSGQNLGFNLAMEDNNHIIRDVVVDSLGAKAGLRDGDNLIEINDEDIREKTHNQVVSLLQNPKTQGKIQLFIKPNDVTSKSKIMTTILTTLNDDHIKQDVNSERITKYRSDNTNDFIDPSLRPTDSMPQIFKNNCPAVLVLQNKNTPAISRETIGTYGVSTCFFYLLTGLYNQEPFSYLDHHDFEVDEDKNPYDTLYSLLDHIFNFLKDSIFATDSLTDISIKKLKNLFLMIGGGCPKQRDIVRYSFSTLINYDSICYPIVHQKMKDNLDKYTAYFFDHDQEIVEAKTSSNPDSSIQPPTLWLIYDAKLNEGQIAITWKTINDEIDLAHMFFQLPHKSPENGFNWVVNHEKIEQLKEKIDYQSLKAKKLEKALSCIPTNGLFRPSFSPLELMYAALVNEVDEAANDD